MLLHKTSHDMLQQHNIYASGKSAVGQRVIQIFWRSNQRSSEGSFRYVWKHASFYTALCNFIFLTKRQLMLPGLWTLDLSHPNSWGQESHIAGAASSPPRISKVHRERRQAALYSKPPTCHYSLGYRLFWTCCLPSVPFTRAQKPAKVYHIHSWRRLNFPSPFPPPLSLF